MSQGVSQEALTGSLVEKEVFTKEEFWELVGVVDEKMDRKGKGES